MEDVKIGRNSQPIQQAIAASTVSKRFLPGSGARWGLTISPPSSGVIWIVPGPTATAGQGYCMGPGDAPLRLSITYDGQQVLQDWSVVADAGAPVFVVVEHRLLPGSDRSIYDP